MSSNSVNLSSLLSAMGSTASGIDVASTVDQLIYAERARERQWQSQQATLKSQSDALTQLSSTTQTLEDALNALGDPVSAMTSMAVSSSNQGIVTAAAAPGTAAGSHVIQVQNLATTASWYSDPAATADSNLAAGSFSLTVGGTTKSVTIGSGVNTLNQLVSYINSNFTGVQASVVNDASGSRLAIVATQSGSAADFSITNGAGLQFTRAVQGTNASLTVDGIPISSATNTVTGAVVGLSVNLQGADKNAQVNVTVQPDSSQIQQAVSAFVAAYNTAIQQTNAQFKYDTTTKTGAPLAGDSTVRMLQSSLFSAGAYSGGSGSITTLRSLGITMNDDGTLSVDSTALSNAVANSYKDVLNFMQGSASNGFAAFLKNQLDLVNDPLNGAFTVELNSIRSQNDSLQRQVDDFEVYLSGEETRLTTQYNQIDAMLQQLPAQQAQIDAMLGNSGSKK